MFGIGAGELLILAIGAVGTLTVAGVLLYKLLSKP
jgi:hypothetical protein